MGISYFHFGFALPALIGLPVIAFLLVRFLGAYLSELLLFASAEVQRLRRRAVVEKHAASIGHDTPQISEYAPRDVAIAVSEVLEQICGTSPAFRAGDDLRKVLRLSDDDIDSLVVLSSQRLNLWWPTVRTAFGSSPANTLGDIVHSLSRIYTASAS